MSVRCTRNIALVSMAIALIMVCAAVDRIRQREIRTVYIAATCLKMHEVRETNISRLHPMSLRKIGTVGDLIIVAPNGSCTIVKDVRITNRAVMTKLYTFEHHFYFAQLSTKKGNRTFFVGRWPPEWWDSGTKQT